MARIDRIVPNVIGINNPEAQRNLSEWGEVYLDSDEYSAAERAAQVRIVQQEAKDLGLNVETEFGWMSGRDWTRRIIPEGASFYLRVYIKEA